jgi:hypothetical protein
MERLSKDMPTRKEILEELGISMDELRDSMGETSSNFGYSAEQIEEAARQFGLSAERLEEVLAERAGEMARASEKFGSAAESVDRSSHRIEESVSNISTEIITGVVGGGLLAGLGYALVKGISHAKKRYDHLWAKEDMVGALIDFEKKHGRLTYDLILDRLFVEGLNREGRREMLNELIYEKIVLEHLEGGREHLAVDVYGKALEDFREHVDQVRQNLDDLASGEWKNKGTAGLGEE